MHHILKCVAHLISGCFDDNLKASVIWHSSLLRWLVNYSRKKIYNIGPWSLSKAAKVVGQVPEANGEVIPAAINLILGKKKYFESGSLWTKLAPAELTPLWGLYIYCLWINKLLLLEHFINWTLKALHS